MTIRTIAASSLAAVAALTSAHGWAQEASAPATAEPAPIPSQPNTTPVPASDPAANPAPGAQIAAFVDQQFPQADTDGNGALSAAEFEVWIGKLKTAELETSGKPVDQADVKAYASKAFAAADGDADKLVSKTELTRFLGQA